MRLRTIALSAAFGLSIGIGVALATGAGGGEPRFHGTAYLPPAEAADFPLIDQRGRAARISDFRGSAALLFFGYTTCPDVCPLTLTKLSRVVGALGKDAERVRILLVTTDPSNDTPAALARYTARFDTPVVGLTADSATLTAMRAAYGVYAAPSPAHAGHGMTHTPAVFGIDPAGQIRVLLPMEQPDEVIAGDVRALLRE